MSMKPLLASPSRSFQINLIRRSPVYIRFLCRKISSEHKNMCTVHNRNMIWSDSRKSRGKILKNHSMWKKKLTKDLPSFFADKVQKRSTGAPDAVLLRNGRGWKIFYSGGQFGNSYFQVLTSLAKDHRGLAILHRCPF